MTNELSTSSHGNCGHWVVRHRTCLACKTKLTQHEGRSFRYLISGLNLSIEAIFFTKRLTTLTSLYVHKKLHLVLDLDHTLLHAINAFKLAEAERYILDDDESGSRKNIQKDHKLIKFRPFVSEFLEEANKLFNMYVYTRAGQDYAHRILRMLDPDKTYFGDRVITSRESPKTKNLDLVLADERGTLIVDDSVDVWPYHRRNLLQITRYFYFKHDHYLKDSKSSSYAERKTDESRSKGALANLLKFLKEIHSEFFSCELEQELDSKDVRLLFKGPFKPNGC